MSRLYLVAGTSLLRRLVDFRGTSERDTPVAQLISQLLLCRLMDPRTGMFSALSRRTKLSGTLPPGGLRKGQEGSLPSSGAGRRVFQKVMMIAKGSSFAALADRLAGNVDIWWIVADGGILVLLPLLLKKQKVWAHCQIQLFVVAEEVCDDPALAQRELETYVRAYRLNIEVHVKVVRGTQEEQQPSTARFGQCHGPANFELFAFDWITAGSQLGHVEFQQFCRQAHEANGPTAKRFSEQSSQHHWLECWTCVSSCLAWDLSKRRSAAAKGQRCPSHFGFSL